jgi:hypothetical protein
MADLVWPIISIGIGGIIVLIGILYTLMRFRDKKSGIPAQDERTRKINGIAATYALNIGLYFMIAVMLALIIGQEFFSMPDLSAGPVIIASVLVFSLTYLGLRWHFNRKGVF